MSKRFEKWIWDERCPKCYGQLWQAEELFYESFLVHKCFHCGFIRRYIGSETGAVEIEMLPPSPRVKQQKGVRSLDSQEQEIVIENMALAERVAMRFWYKFAHVLRLKYEQEDVITAAYLGLNEAVRRLGSSSVTGDPAPYCTAVIKNNLRLLLMDHTHHKDMRKRVLAARRQLEARGIACSSLKLAEESGVPVEKVRLILWSLERSLNESQFRDEPDGPEWGDAIASPVSQREFEAVDSRIYLEQVLYALEERERTALLLRYVDDFSIEDVADALGIAYLKAASIISSAVRKARLAFPDHTRQTLHARGKTAQRVRVERGTRDVTGRPPALTEEQIAEVVRLHAGGASQISLALMFGCHRNTIRSVLDHGNVPRRGKKSA